MDLRRTRTAGGAGRHAALGVRGGERRGEDGEADEAAGQDRAEHGGGLLAWCGSTSIHHPPECHHARWDGATRPIGRGAARPTRHPTTLGEAWARHGWAGTAAGLGYGAGT